MRSITVVTIEDYIIKNQLSKAVVLMKETAKELLKNQKMYDALLTVEANFNGLINQKLTNTISDSDLSVEISKIRESLVEFKSEIEKHLKDRAVEDGIRNPEIEQLLAVNAYALMVGDLEMLSKTYHAEIKAEQINFAQQIFQHVNIDLIYDIKSVKIVEMTEEFATASVVQLTTKKDESDLFRNNQMKMNHTFKKENGRWKIFSSLTMETKYF
ncbi:MAG: hypothetical protein AAF573_09995 [Bacteroidota bacterium]